MGLQALWSAWGSRSTKPSDTKAALKMAGFCCQVHSDDSAWTKRAKEILERTGAQDVSSTGEATADKDHKTRVREVA